MTDILTRISLVAVAFAALVSCADTKDNSTDMEEMVLERWMQTNRPDIPKVDDGLYYKIYPVGTPARKVELQESKSWVYTTGLGKNLEGDYFFNMYPAIARRLGTYKASTHFVPEITRYYSGNSDLTDGVYRALAHMNIGDSLELYCSSRYAFGTNGSSTPSVEGFAGNVTIPSSTPVYRALRLDNITDDPAEISRREVIEYATQKLGKLASDSLKDGLYLKITQSVSGGENVKEDDDVDIYYAGRYIDGKVFDTNIKSVAQESGIYESTKSYSALNFNGSSFVDGFKEAILNMKQGEKATVVFTYRWGYGISGSNSDGVYIRPFDSLVFDIEIEKQ